MMTTTSSNNGYPEDAPTPVRRAWALTEAKRILSMAPFAEIAVYEMVDLSHYILTGEDPLKNVQVPKRPCDCPKPS